MWTWFFTIIILVSCVAHLNGKVLNEFSIIDIVNDVAAKPQLSNGKKGLTFVKEHHLAEFGIDAIGCRDWSDPNGMDCNAYTGDTDCNELRPVLCAKVDNSPRPPYYVYGNGAAMSAYFYAGWNRGHITTSAPVKGSEFVNKNAVDAFCAESFGDGWRVVEFHDGYYIPNMNGTTYAGASWTQNANQQQTGGWHFYSYGDVQNNVRFWVHITDQPSTCWGK